MPPQLFLGPVDFFLDTVGASSLEHNANIFTASLHGPLEAPVAICRAFQGRNQKGGVVGVV